MGNLIPEKKLLTNHSWLQVNKYCPWHMFPRVSFRKEGAEGVVLAIILLHHAVWLNTMLQAVQLPASITHLDTSLAHMNGYDLPHFGCNNSKDVILNLKSYLLISCIV